MKKYIIALILIIIVAGGVFFYWQQNRPSLLTDTKPTQVACTMETKLCPDGVTYVGRQGPDCEFAECPTVVSEEEPIIKTGVEKSGIVVVSPKAGDVIKLPIKVTGYITGENGWLANEGEVGNVVLVDGNGKTISNVEILKATTDWLQQPTFFEANVGDREMASYIGTNEGKLIFSAQGAKNNELINKFEVVVRFK